MVVGMRSVIFPDARTLTEAEYLDLGETLERIELFDGNLYMAPNPGVHHQHLRSELRNVLRQAAREAALDLYLSVNVRLRPGRIVIPDVVATTKIDGDLLVVDAAAVRLVCEVVSPSSEPIDRVLKAHYYAAAGIPWYLTVSEQDGTLHLSGRPHRDSYLAHAVAAVGEELPLTDPFAVTIDPAMLLSPL
jgi:Uma2 family endonuclease